MKVATLEVRPGDRIEYSVDRALINANATGVPTKFAFSRELSFVMYPGACDRDAMVKFWQHDEGTFHIKPRGRLRRALKKVAKVVREDAWS